jgi:NADH:ubiquinone oxidoreductase subunit F (NADH-binding)
MTVTSGVVHREVWRAGDGDTGSAAEAADECRPWWPASAPAVGSLAGESTTLVTANWSAREARADYEARGGYRPVPDGEELIESVAAAELVGRGGAAFPLAIKLRAVRERPGPRYVVANGEEGEPLSVKDRWLLRTRPHLVLDGLFAACRAVDAVMAFVYVSDPVAAASVRVALGELDDAPVPVEILRVAPAYVAGEETAVIRAVNGGPALPTDKPPRPFEAGVGSAPTLVSNVETLANLPSIDHPAGTFLLTLSGSGRSPKLYEAPLGTRLADLLTAANGLTEPPRGALMGGFFAGLIGPRILDLPLSYRDLREAGSGLGCGALWLLADEDCAVRVAADVMSYYEDNNARQCGPCIRGTSAMNAALARLAGNTATAEDLTRLTGWSTSLRGRGACTYLDGGTNLVTTLLREFPEDVERHRSAACPRCPHPLARDIGRFRVALDS